MSIPSFTLQRLEQTSFATYGELRDANGQRVCYTLELPWVDADHDGHRDRNVSRIAAGTYTAFRRKAATTKHGYDVFELEHVPDCDYAQLHIANLPSQLEACVALGSNWYDFPEGKGITGSAAAFARFMDHLAGVNEITLTVVDVEASA